MGLSKDLLNDTEVVEVFSSSQRSSNANGSQVDTKKRNSCVMSLHVSGYTDGTHDFTVEHAKDDGTGSPDTWDSVPSDQLDGSFPSVTESGDTGVHRVGVYTNRRFVRVTTSVSGTTDGATYGVLSELGHLRYDKAGSNPATNTV